MRRHWEFPDGKCGRRLRRSDSEKTMPTQAAKRKALKIAREECARCRGRECGDCSDECGYFRRTASKAEIEEAARIDANFRPCGAKQGYHELLPASHQDFLDVEGLK